MTPAQVRMARAALELSPERLASQAALSAEDVEAVELGGGRPEVVAKLRATFERCGIEFVGHEGVKVLAGPNQAAASLSVEQLNSANDE